MNQSTLSKYSDTDVTALYSALSIKRGPKPKPARKKVFTKPIGRPKGERRNFTTWLSLNPNLTIALQTIAQKFLVDLEGLLSKSRLTHYNPVRQGAIYVLREYKLSFPEIGFLLQRDHSTIIHSFNLSQLTLKQNEVFALKVQELIVELEPKLKEFAKRAKRHIAIIVEDRSKLNRLAV